jgi:hypothetical protein
MPRRCDATLLRRLRNEVPIDRVIADLLQIPAKVSEGHFRFLCPVCSDFNTATNPRTNLARCFRCERNFNPIDIVMVVEHVGFRGAVGLLRPMLPADPHRRPRSSPALPAVQACGAGPNSTERPERRETPSATRPSAPMPHTVPSNRAHQTP